MIIYRHLASISGLVLALLCVTLLPAHTQTLRQEPVSLSTVPRGATAANPYWQHLVIDLIKNPSAGNTIIIPLPVGVTVADTDGDGSVLDEISLDGDAGSDTGYGSTAGSSADSIRIQSTTGGALGAVHVQFPVVTASTPGVARSTYGPVTFSNGGEKTIPSGTLTITYVAASGLQLAIPTRLFIDGVVDTTTNAQGDRYPATAAAIFTTALPNLVRDELGTLGANHFDDLAIPYNNGDDTDDVIFRFWWSSTDSLTVVNTGTATAAIDASLGSTAHATESNSVAFAFDVSALAPATWYLYMTSQLTGTLPLVRSRGVTVRHSPLVLSVAAATSGDPDWLDSGRLLDFDTGTNGAASAARDALAMTVSVVDFDDTASVRLFYSPTATLDTTVVTTSGSAPNRTVTGLTGGSHVDSTITLSEGIDSTISWQVGRSDANFVTAGDYYVYAVATDGTALAIGRSDTLYHVRHSPFLGLDSRQDAVLNTGGPSPDRYYTITWNQDYGIDGDFDRDTASGTIDLYYSDDSGLDVPDGVAALTAAAADTSADTHAIVTGLSVDSDGQDDNQYRWDLWTYTNPDDGGVPTAGIDYTIYGVITTGSTKRLVRWEDGAGTPRVLNITHDPHVTIEAPLSDVSIDGHRSLGVSWEATDVDDDASIWVFLTPVADGMVLGELTAWADLEAGATALWTATSADGSLATGLAEDENTSASVSVRPARLQLQADGSASPIADGDYALYVVIDATGGAVPAADSPAQRTPGSVIIDGFGAAGAAGLAGPALEVLPGTATIATWRDTAVFTLRPNSNGESVDVVSVFLSVDTLLTSIVDQDTSQAGVQPFKVNSQLSGQTLFDSVKASTDSLALWVMDLVYFEQAGRVFDGDTDLATIALASKNIEGTARLAIDNLEPRRSAFYRSGTEVGFVPAETGAVLDIRPRGSLAGTVKLQGRTQYSAEVTFELRGRNSFTPVSDSLFVAVNDVNTTKAGLQDTLDSLGGYSLTQVPTGSWHMAAQVDRYVEGQLPDFRVEPGDVLTNMDPTWLRDGTTKLPFLLGGDVTGWEDTSGVSSPDNEVDQLDVDFITTYFGVSTTPTHAGQLADVDGDSLVWVPDLNMVAANFGSHGPSPSFRAAHSTTESHGETARVQLHSQRDDSGRLTVSVVGDALAEVRAYGLTFAYDENLWRPEDRDARSVFGARPALEAYRNDGNGRVHLAAALIGEGVANVGDDALGSIVFTPLHPMASSSTAGVDLLAATVVGGDHQARAAQWSGSGSGAVLPGAFALQPAFPNPFNPETTLRIEIPTAASVRLDVYDVTGQKVRTLLAGTLAAGVHTVRWDGLDGRGQSVASGAYFARLQARGFRSERKMLLLR
jgi:hypothetical protein